MKSVEVSSRVVARALNFIASVSWTGPSLLLRTPFLALRVCFACARVPRNYFERHDVRCFLVFLLIFSPFLLFFFLARGGDAEPKKELTPAEKKAQKALRAAADKERKRKVNAPARITKIEVRKR